MVQRLYHYLLKNQVIFALFLVVAGWLVFQTRSILASIFIAYIINTALLPFVHYLKRKRFPHFFAAFVPFVSMLLILTLIIFPLVPFLIDQITSLIIGLPEFLGESATILGFEVDVLSLRETLTSELSAIGRNAFNVTSRVFGGVFSLLTIMVVSFYLVLYHDKFKENIAALFHRNERERVLNTLNKVDETLGAWLRGQVVLSLVIGFMTWTVLSILGLPFALPLAIIAGLLEIVPTLGPIIASIPAIIVAFTVSPTMAIIIALVYVVIQLLENNILVPKIMQRAVGLNPVVVITAVMIGANLMGVMGALLSIPFVSFLIVLFNSANQE